MHEWREPNRSIMKHTLCLAIYIYNKSPEITKLFHILSLKAIGCKKWQRGLGNRLHTDAVNLTEILAKEYHVWRCMNRLMNGIETTQPTSGGAVTVDSSCCSNCVEPSRLIYRFFGMPAMRTRWMAGAAAHKSG